MSEAEPVIAKPTNLATAIPTLAANAAKTAFRSPPVLTRNMVPGASERREAVFRAESEPWR